MPQRVSVAWPDASDERKVEKLGALADLIGSVQDSNEEMIHISLATGDKGCDKFVNPGSP
eukprot:3596782-Amphidinium_carterae.1